MDTVITPRKQPPLPPELRPERPRRLSFTWLSHYARCKHSAYLYTQYGSGGSSHEMERGSVVHEVIARLTNECLERGENEVPFDLAKAVLAEVFSENFTVPFTEWDYMRQCVYHWARYTVLQPDELLGVEQLLVWDLGDWRISGKVDLAWMSDDTVAVRDYKTARWPQSQEDFENSAQTKLYSLLLAYGKPVTVRVDEETGEVTETVEPYSLGESAQFFKVSEQYPGVIWDKDEPTERMAIREHTLTRADLLDEKVLVEALLNQVTTSFETGQWDAVPGDDQCGKCPARKACPLPAVLLPAPGLIETPELAEHYAMASFFLEQEKKDVDKAIKAWGKPIPLNDEEVYAVVQERRSELDKKKLAADIEAGIAGPLEDYQKVSYSNRFRRRKATDLVEPEPTNGTVDAPAPKSLDEKYGETMPA